MKPVSAAKLKYDDKKRVMKEAYNKKVFGKPVVITGAERRIIEKAQTDVGSECPNVNRAVEVKVTKTVKVIYCVTEDIPYIYDHLLEIYRRWTTADTVVIPGFLIANVTEQKSGAYTTTTYSDDRVSGISIVSCANFSMRITHGDWHHPRSFCVSEHFVKLLSKKLPNYSRLVEKDRTASMALVSAAGGNDSDLIKCLMSTVVFYESSREEIKEHMRSRQFSNPSADVIATVATYVSLGIDYTMGNAYGTAGVTLPDLPYALRPDIEVKVQGGALFDTSTRTLGLTTLANSESKWHRKNFFRILGRQQVSTPDNNGANLIGGLGRLLAEDIHAPFLRYQQEQLALMFPTQHKLLSTLGYDVEEYVDYWGSPATRLSGTKGNYSEHSYLLSVNGVLEENYPKYPIEELRGAFEHDFKQYVLDIGFDLDEYHQSQQVAVLAVNEFSSEMRDRINQVGIFTNKKVRRKLDVVKTGLLTGVAYTVKGFLDGGHWLLGSQHSRAYISQIEHVKRWMRIKYVNDFPVLTEMPTRFVNISLKDEDVKYMKRARITGAYDAGCMISPHLAAITKCGGGYYEFEHDGWTCVYKLVTYPSETEISECFEDMDRLCGTRTVYICACGDDSIMTAIWDGHWIQVETDMASCDSNQRVGTWLLGAYIAQDWDALIKEILSLTMLPLQILNPSNKQERIVVTPCTPIMASGHSWTSFNNGNISGCIAVTLTRLLSLFYKSHSIEQIVGLSAFTFGHRLTIVHNECKEQGMFLKNHPVLCHHPIYGTAWKHLLAVGTYMRGFGTTDSKFCAASIGVSTREFTDMNPKEVANRYMSVVVSGLKHQPHNPILDALRERFNVLPTFSGGVATEEYISLSLKHVKYKHEDLSEWTVDADSFARMYSFVAGEQEELVHAIRSVEIGHIITSSAVEKILKLDYSVVFDEDAFVRL